MTEREKQANDMLQTIAKDIAKLLPEGFGFALLAYEFGNSDGERKMLYVSNGNREDVAKAMTEWVGKVSEDTYGKDQ